MAKPKEIELKLEVERNSLAEIEKAPLLRDAVDRASTDELVSVYFDTRDFKLRDKGVSLRIRSDGKRHVQTIKADRFSSVGNFSRDEWESEVGGRKPDFKAAKGTALEPLLSPKLKKALRPIFETRVRRQTFPVRAGASAIDLAIDLGRIDTRGRSTSLSEIELELKDGDPAELFSMAAALDRITPVRLGLKSKADRGYALLTRTTVSPASAEDIVLDPDQPCAEAFQVIAYSCLRHLAANREAVDSGDPEGVHEMRVGIRRLRAALSLFSDMLAGTEVDHVRDELKWLTAELGPARELDVFANRVLKPLRGVHGRERAMLALYDDVARRRSEAFRRAREAVNSDRFRRLLLEAAAWIEAGQWLRQTGPGSAARDAPIADFAPRELERRRKKIVKPGKRLAELDPEARHKLRIAGKKLRYASEFFRSLFAGKTERRRYRPFLKSLKRFQDCLGDLNDIAAHERIAAGLAEEARARANSGGRDRFAYLAGIVAGQEESRRRAVMASAKRVHRGFRDSRQFWK